MLKKEKKLVFIKKYNSTEILVSVSKENIECKVLKIVSLKLIQINRFLYSALLSKEYTIHNLARVRNKKINYALENQKNLLQSYCGFTSESKVISRIFV